MKARIANETGRYILNVYITDHDAVTPVGEFDHNDFDKLSEEYSFDSLKKKYPKMISCGFLPIFDTPSGELEPGCLFWVHGYPENMFWDNHTGPHLHAVLPNGNHWNIDGRANNCTSPNDRLHRCWVRTGEVPNITVGKGGNTCAAGAGSILSGNYHGFLINGEFTE
jgi:hypothetical protein